MYRPGKKTKHYHDHNNSVLRILPSFSRLGEEDLDIKDWVEADTDLGLGDENRFRDMSRVTCHVSLTLHVTGHALFLCLISRRLISGMQQFQIRTHNQFLIDYV